MKNSKLIRISEETSLKIDHVKPDWMSYDQFIRGLLTPVDAVPEPSQPFVSLNLKDAEVGELRSHMIQDSEELKDFKNHLKYLKRKYNLVFRFEVNARSTGFEIQVFRTH